MRANFSLYVLTIFILAVALWAWLTPIDVSIRAVGIVRPAGEVVKVLSDVPGRIAALATAEGATVRRGDILLTLDSRSLLLKRSALLSNIHFSELRLSDLDARIASLTALNSTSASLDAVTIDETLHTAATRFTRAADLFDAGLASTQSLDDARSALLRAESESSALALKRAESESRLQSLSSDRTPLLAAIAAAYKDLEQTQLDLTRFTITAPVSGRIASLAPLHPGELLAAGAAIATIIPDSEPLIVESWLPSPDRIHVQPGQSVRLRLDTEYGIEYLSGTVSSIAPDVQVTNGLPLYRVLIDPIPHSAIRNPHSPGLTLDVHFITRTDRILTLLFNRIRREFQESF